MRSNSLIAGAIIASLLAVAMLAATGQELHASESSVSIAKATKQPVSLANATALGPVSLPVEKSGTYSPKVLGDAKAISLEGSGAITSTVPFNTKNLYTVMKPIDDLLTAESEIAYKAPFDQRIALADLRIANVTDPTADADTDGISNVDEINGTGSNGIPTDPNNPDSDGDGLTDLRELWWLCDPSKKDTNGDNISDGDSIVKRTGFYPYIELDEVQDLDHDGIPNSAEMWDTLTNPRIYSTDGDRYGDGEEYFQINMPQNVESDPLLPSVPDIVIRVIPPIKLNLKRDVIIGNRTIVSGEHTLALEKEAQQSLTTTAGAKTAIKADLAWPPWSSKAGASAEVSTGIDFEASSGFAQRLEDKKSAAEEAYRATAIDLSGSTLQVSIAVQNIGNAPLQSTLRQIMLNFYMGNDSTLLYTTPPLPYEFDVLLPGTPIRLTVKDIPIDFEEYKRFMAGESIRVNVIYYSFGKDQEYLREVKSLSIEIDIDDQGIKKQYLYVREDISLEEALGRAKIPFHLSDDGSFASLNGKQVKTDAPPYQWWTIYISNNTWRSAEDVSDAEKLPNMEQSKIKDISLGAGDLVVLKLMMDSDGDLLPDDQELLEGTNPNVRDTDGDGLSDGSSIPELRLEGERNYGTNPLLYDTDKDGYSDGEEVQNKTDPNDASSPVVTLPPAVHKPGPSNTSDAKPPEVSVTSTNGKKNPGFGAVSVLAALMTIIFVAKRQRREK